MRRTIVFELFGAVWLNRLCFLPALAVLGVETIRTTLYRWTVSCRPVLGFSLSDCTPATITFAGRVDAAFPATLGLDARFLWFSVLVLLACVAASVIVAGIVAVVPAFAGLSRRGRNVAIGLVALAILITAVTAFFKAQTFLLVEQILAPRDGPLPAGVGRFLQTAASIARSLTFSAAASLVAVACTTLIPSAGATAANGEETLRGQVERLQTVLYVGGTLLVLATLEFKLFFDWIVLAFSPEQREFLRPVITASLAGNGAVYPLFLAAVYLPASFVLRYRTSRLSVRVAPELGVQERSRWLEERGLAPSWVRSASRVAVVFARTLPVLR